MNNFSKYCISRGGKLKPLLIDSSLTNGTGLMNASIFIDNNKAYCIVRHVNYTLFHSEGKKFHHFYGPLQYVHPENDMHLRTTNFLCELNENLEIIKTNKIDTSSFDKDPLWDFVGLEDARLVKWNNKFYATGVRRDTTTNGQGRMELSELEITDTSVKEISRFRIPTPKIDSYCEKNWMPLLDKPFHYIKWSNPTEVVKVDIENNKTETIYLEEEKIIPDLCDFRGSSQVIEWNGYYLSLIHEVRLFNSELGRKDGKYFHRFVLWDKDFNLIKFSELFDFMSGDIEFCCGLAKQDDSFIISFGFQDNAAFVLKFHEEILFDFLNIEKEEKEKLKPIPVIGTAIVNGFHWIERLINSIDYPVENLVIFDNNGRGQLTTQLDDLKNKKYKYIKNIKVCHLPSNLGCSTAWNLIIKSFPMSPYWIICNHDISFSPGFLKKMINLSTPDDIGMVHAEPGEWGIGSWELFLIKDFVIQQYGLFDENLYPAYEEDVDYFMRILADGEKLKRIISVEMPFYHGNGNSYENGSQTVKEEPNISKLIDKAQTLNQEKYMKNKWGEKWRYCNPYKYPFNNKEIPLTYTCYDLNFIREKYLGF